MRSLAIIGSAFLLGCGGVGGGTGTKAAGEVFDTPTGTAQCQKFEQGNLQEGMSFQLGGVTITITDLRSKDDSGGGELIGFTLSGSGVSYLVKAGGEGYYGKTATWVNPNGTSGSKAHAISHVTICVGDTSGGIPDGSLGDGACTNCPGGDSTSGGDPAGFDSPSTSGGSGSGSGTTGGTGDPPVG